MGIFDSISNVFKKNEPEASVDPLKDYVPSNLQVGWYVDYDTTTWQVTASHYYDFGSGDIVYEWQLKSVDDVVYLNKESDDEIYWSVYWSIPFGKLGPGVKDHIVKHEDPPEQIVLDGTTFYASESGAGKFYKDGVGPAKPFVKWWYEDDTEEEILVIEQWGESEFEAYRGEYADEYELTNILPSGK